MPRASLEPFPPPKAKRVGSPRMDPGPHPVGGPLAIEWPGRAEVAHRRTFGGGGRTIEKENEYKSKEKHGGDNALRGKDRHNLTMRHNLTKPDDEKGGRGVMADIPNLSGREVFHEGGKSLTGGGVGH